MSAVDTYIDQSAMDLRLSVVTGTLEKEHFNLLTTERRETSFGAIEAHIIGGSHICSLKIDKLTLHEVFACVDFELNRGRYAIRTDSMDQVLAGVNLNFKKHGVRYTFQSELVELDQAAVDRIAVMEQPLPGDSTIQMIRTFDKREEDDHPPTTIVLVKNLDFLRGKEIRLETLHSYPNEGKSVFTRTCVFL